MAVVGERMDGISVFVNMLHGSHSVDEVERVILKRQESDIGLDQMQGSLHVTRVSVGLESDLLTEIQANGLRPLGHHPVQDPGVEGHVPEVQLQNAFSSKGSET
jgi:hypothetical protein